MMLSIIRHRDAHLSEEEKQVLALRKEFENSVNVKDVRSEVAFHLWKQQRENKKA